MKNLIRTGMLALVTTIVFSSCGDGDKSANKTKIDTPNVQIDTAKKDQVKATIDTTKKDTAKK